MRITKKIVKNAIIFLFILVAICIAYRMFVAYEMHCTPDRALSNISQGDIIYQYNYHQYVIAFTCDKVGNIFCHILKRTSISNLVWYTIVKSEGPHKPWPNPDAGRDEQLPVYLTMTLFSICWWLSNNPTTIFVLWRNLWRGCRIIHDQWHTLLFRHSHMARISYNRFPIVCRGQTIYPCCSRNFLATKLFY